MKAYGPGSANPSVTSKIIRRLFVTNLPKDYQDVVGILSRAHGKALKDFLTDTINKCVDQEIAQPPITSLIAFKEQGYAVIELQTPEMATACLAMDGIPFESSLPLSPSVEAAASASCDRPTSTPTTCLRQWAVLRVSTWRKWATRRRSAPARSPKPCQQPPAATPSARSSSVTSPRASRRTSCCSSSTPSAR